MALAGAARSLTEVYLAYGVGVGLGVGLSYVPVLGVVQRWFMRLRGFASGIAVSGIGVGTIIMPPIATWLIDVVGWRVAYMLIGGLVAAIGIGMSLLIVNDPQERGTAPDGDPIGPQLNLASPQGASIREAIRSPHFITLYAACLLCSFGVFVPFAHLVPYALDHGIPQSSAVLILGAIGIGSTMGRFFLGGLADRLGRKVSLLAMFAGMALAMGIWAFSTEAWQLGTFALVYGLFYGGWVALLPAVVMDEFGGEMSAGSSASFIPASPSELWSGRALPGSRSISPKATHCRLSHAYVPTSSAPASLPLRTAPAWSGRRRVQAALMHSGSVNDLQ